MSLLLLFGGVGTPSGDMTGSIALSFSPSGALTGSGALAGSVPLAFTQTGALTGSGALAGSIPLALTVSGSMIGSGALAGSVPLAFTPSGALTGSGVLSGSIPLAFAASGALTGSGTLASAIALDSALVGALTGTGALAGSIPLAFDILGQFDQVVVITPDVGGGYGFGAFDRKRKKHELDEEERVELADRLEAVMLEDGSLTQQKADLLRMRGLANEYLDDLPNRVKRAVAYAEKVRTQQALELALREMERLQEDDEVALLLAIHLDS